MATDLGQLVYTLTLNDEGFQGQLGSASAKVKESSGQMSGALAQTEEQSGKTGGAFSGMAAQFVAGQAMFTIAQKGLSLIKDTLKDGVKSFEDWQTNQAQIANALKTTHDASGQTTKSLNEYADSLSSQTGITGNAINSAQEMLLKYTNIGKDVFPGATKATADLASAMSGGGVPGLDAMTGASKLLGVALSDPEQSFGRLKKAGVVLTDQQKEQIKTMQQAGNVAGAQKAVLDDLAGSIGGKAATAAHTLAGEQAQLHANLEKVEIVIGQKLTAAFKAIEPYLIKFGNWVMEHKVVLAALVGIFAGLAIAIGVALVTALWAIVAPAIAAVIALWPIILIGGAIGAIAYEIATHWSTLKQWFSDFIRDVKQWFQDGINFVKEHWALIVDIILGPLGIVITQVIEHWKSIKNGFLDAVNFVKNVWGSIVSFFSGIWHGISSAVGQVGTVLKGVFRDAFNAIIGLWDDTMGKLFHGQRIGVGPAHFDLPNLNIPKMATGGIVESATLALIGEAGPEAVVPLSKGNNPMGNTNYNFSAGSVILSTAEAVDEFFNIGNRSTALELQGGAPLAGTTRV